MALSVKYPSDYIRPRISVRCQPCRGTGLRINIICDCCNGTGQVLADPEDPTANCVHSKPGRPSQTPLSRPRVSN